MLYFRDKLSSACSLQVDLWKCVQEAACITNTSRRQLVIMRDPRAATSSSYFFLKAHGKMSHETSLDQYFQKNLEVISQWMSLRYFFFTQILADQSELFWYEDHQDDPFDWHVRYLAFIGLNLPVDETLAIARTASEGDLNDILGYNEKGIDVHPGSPAKRSNYSTFEDELGEESLQMMNDVVRRWLPPVVLRKLGLL